MASEATKITFRDNMHMDTRVIEVVNFKPEVKFGGTDMSWNVRCSLAWRCRLQYLGVVILSIVWSSKVFLG